MTRPITLRTKLQPIFESLQKREVFASPPAGELVKRFDDAILSAAIAKCVDLNALINSGKIKEENAFLFVANLRGVAEELIVLQYLAKMSSAKRRKLLILMQHRSLSDGLLTQVAFFAANNPFQPVAGGDPTSLEAQLQQDNAKIREFWKSQGEAKRNGPTVRDMAERSGLVHTYDYIYFLSSNFVHFNLHTLLRMGWGAEQGPFVFSVHNFARYYADLASFYGAVLFLGFYFRLGRGLFSAEAEAEVEQILKLIDEVPRWPEIVTFEEMNRKPPMLPFMAHAMRKALEGTDERVPYGAILREVRGLDA